MKLKFPKKIIIGDQTFNMVYDKKRIDAEFYYWEKKDNGSLGDGKMIIGTKLLQILPLKVLNNIIHELIEVIQAEQGARYKNPLDDSYEFHYNHTQHTDLCSRLSGLLDLFIK